MVELDRIGFDVPGRTLLHDIGVSFPAGRFSVVLGPNGAGKSTLLRIAAGLLRPRSGEVSYGGKSIARWPAGDLARVRGVLSQHAEPAFPLSAGEVVAMGRYPHYDRVPGRRDLAAIERALVTVGMADRSSQRFTTLSSGERQRIQMARVIAQMDVEGDPPRVLFLDEPTASLDVRHQLALLDLARSLLARNVTVVAVLHDLHLAEVYGDFRVLLDAGRIVWSGTRDSGLPEELIGRVYQVRARRIVDPGDGGGLWRFTTLA
ncbi:MAG: ATP-binding cassette domain-containing protein [Candidatus Eisenbacteria bacterium]|nr:ATP-binding cassette domain-containing protein [Candidatus Eisenbacteria bacterium]